MGANAKEKQRKVAEMEWSIFVQDGYNAARLIELSKDTSKPLITAGGATVVAGFAMLIADLSLNAIPILLSMLSASVGVGLLQLGIAMHEMTFLELASKREELEKNSADYNSLMSHDGYSSIGNLGQGGLAFVALGFLIWLLALGLLIYENEVSKSAAVSVIEAVLG